MKDLQTLKTAQAAVMADPSLMPAGGVTHCNAAAIKVANAMGCRELDNLMADQQYAVMTTNKLKTWNRVIGTAASLWAQQGGLAFAAMTSVMLGESHGHIASLTPEPMQMSGSLERPVPMVLNIGKQDADEKESAAFPVSKGEADYFIYLG